MRIEPSREISGVLLVHLDGRPDDRGRFIETFRQEWFADVAPMVQANRSDSQPGVVRALHYHLHQADYWYVTHGRIFVALHDLRQSSPTNASSHSFEIGDGIDIAVYIPPGVAHGFQALTDCTLTYLVDRYYDADDEHGLAWDDPDAGIPWPIPTAIVSDRDRTNPKRADIPPDKLPP